MGEILKMKNMREKKKGNLDTMKDEEQQERGVPHEPIKGERAEKLSFIDLLSEKKQEPLMQFSKPLDEAGWKKMTATVDSRPSDAVANEDTVSHVETVPSEQSKRGVEYEVANKQTIRNEGEKRCEVIAPGLRGPKQLSFQVCDVRKTLLSVSKLNQAGNTVVFSKWRGNYIENDYTPERIMMRTAGNLFEIDLWVRVLGFTRQGK